MLNILIYLTLFFIFLQDSAFVIGKQAIFVSIVVLWILILVTCLRHFRNLLGTDVNIIKKTPVKYLVLYIIWVIVAGFLVNSFGTGLKILLRTILIWCLTVLPVTVFAIYYFPKFFSYKKLLSFFIIAYNSILIYGIFNYIVRVLHIKPLVILHNFLAPRMILANGNSLISGICTLERATSIFFEPSFYGTFLFLFIPIAYMLFTSKIRFGKTYFQDKTIKYGTVILTWINLVLTMSPMYIVACGIYTLIFFREWIFNIKKMRTYLYLIVFIIFSLFMLYVHNEGFLKDNKVYSRIYNTVISFTDIEQMADKEPSLATRLLTSINTFQATKKHPFLGVGYGNAHDTMYAQYVNTDTPLTWEIQLRAIIEDTAGASSNIFWGLWLQTGLVGIILLYSYFLLSIYYAYKIRKYFLLKDRFFLDSIILVAINYIVISFYWSLETYPMMWFLFGLLNSYILTYKMQIKRLKQIQGAQNV